MIMKKAYAKVNLGLDIVGRRDDGYHLVRMIMQTLNIYDVLTFEKSEDPGIRITLIESEKDMNGSEESSLKTAGGLSLGSDNLIYKAAYIISQRAGYRGGIDITLSKNIPIAAGMAGGSSDCAATLLGVNELLSAGLSDKELMEEGVKLGADVPYCIMGGTALSEGIGDVLTRLKALPESYFVVAKPGISVSTAEAYGGYDEMFGRGDEIIHPDIDGQVEALERSDLEGVADRFLNVLEYVTAARHPEIGRLEQLMKEEGALNAVMSGSGPTVFGVFDNREKAEAAAEHIRKDNLAAQLFVTEPV
jgi:4-diphosphocytidyl-2C-methyl-D-erythritol kinase